MSQDDPLGYKEMNISDTYTVVLRSQGYLEFYQTDKGPWEKRSVPDFMLTPDEVNGLHTFLYLNHEIVS